MQSKLKSADVSFKAVSKLVLLDFHFNETLLSMQLHVSVTHTHTHTKKQEL